MTSTILNLIIDNYLSQIVDIDKSKTKTSILGGSVEFQNIKIKTTMFENLNIPYFELENGFIGNLSIKLTAYNVFSNPIIIEVSDLFVLVKQKKLEELDEKVEIERLESNKKSLLHNTEEFNFRLKNTESVQGGFIQNIINNLQIKVKNIVVRFEDSVSNANYPFAFGLLLKSIYIKTTNENFDDYKNQKEFFKFGEINYKILKVRKLCVFLDYAKSADEIGFNSKIDDEEKMNNYELKSFLGLDYDFYCYCKSEINKYRKNEESHYYLVFKFNFSLHLAKNEVPIKNKLPVLTVDLTVDEQKLKIDVKQISIIFKLISYFSINNLLLVGISNKYYNKSITKEEKITYLENYSKYLSLKYEKDDEAEANKYLVVIESIERGLTFNQIMIMRQIKFEAVESLHLSEEIENIEKSIETQNSRSSFTNFIMGGSNVNNLEKKKIELELKKKIKDQLIESELEKGEMKEEINLDDLSILGDKYIKYKISLNIKSTQFKFSEDYHIDFFKLNFSGFLINIEIGLSLQHFIVSLENISVEEFVSKHLTFSKLLETKYEEHLSPSSSSKSLKEDESKLAFFIDMKITPNDKLTPYYLKVKNNRRLVIYANYFSSIFIFKTIVNSIYSEINLEEIKRSARKEVYKYISEGYRIVNSILSSGYKHFSIDTRINILAPEIIIPKDINQSNCSACFLINMGKLEIFTNLVKKDDSINYQTTKIKEQIYDQYKISITNMEMFTINNYEIYCEDPSNNNYSLKILNKLSTLILIDNSIDPSNENFENIHIEVRTNELKFEIRDTQIEFLIRMLSNLKKTNEILQQHFNNEPKPELKEKNKNVLKSEGFTESNSFKFKEKTDQKESDKGVVSLLFTIKRFELIVLKSLSILEIENMKKINPNQDDLLFKEFINFSIIRTVLSTKLTQKKNISIDYVLSKIFVFDLDSEFKQEDQLVNQVSKNYLLNKEFCCILGSINEDLNHIESRSDYMFTQANDKSYDINQKSFLEFKYDFNFSNNSSNLIITMSKLLISLNFSTILRLNKFFRNIIDLWIEVSQESLKKDLIKVYNEYVNKKKELGVQKINKNFFKGVKSKIIKRKTLNLDDSNKIESDENLIKEVIYLKKDTNQNPPVLTLEQENIHNDIEKTIVSSSFSLNFSLKQIELNIPLDHDSNNTNIFKFNFNTIIRLVYNETAELTFERKILIRKDFKVRNSDISVLLYNIQFDIFSLRDNRFILNAMFDSIFLNSRIIITFNSFLIVENEKVVNTLDLLVEPINLILGFRQIKVLEMFNQKLKDFNSKIKELNPENELDKLYEKKNDYVKKLTKVNQKIERKALFNTNSFNVFYDLSLNIEKVELKLMDNTSYYDIPQAKIEFSRLVLKGLINSDPVDSKNMGLQIVEMISGKQSNDYNINNLYLYIDSSLNMEVSIFNPLMSEWEPLIEPWNVVFKAFQVIKMTRLKLNLKSEKMFNINISDNMIKSINNILKKLKEDDSLWLNEDKKIKKEMEDNKDNQMNIALDFENYTGADIYVWFESDQENKHLIENNKIIQFTKNDMEKINHRNVYDNFFSTKRKFSFCFGNNFSDRNLVVKNIDYSYNHYQEYPIKINDRTLEVLVKIRNNGLVRSIMIEINIFFINNTIYPILLKILPKHKNQKSIFPVQNQENQPNSEYSQIVIGQGKLSKFPIRFIEGPFISYVTILNEDFGIKKEKLLYTDFNIVYRLGKESINYEKNQNNNEKQKILSHMKTYSSKLISFEKNKSLHSLGRIEINNEDINKKDIINIVAEIVVLHSYDSENKSPTYYGILFNPPLYIVNCIPFKIFFNGGNNKVVSLEPKKEEYIYDTDVLDKECKNKISLKYMYNCDIESEEFSLFHQEISNKEQFNIKTVRLFRKTNPTDYIDVNLKYEDFDYRESYNSTFLKMAKIQYRTKKIILYVDYLILNRLDTKLYIKPSNLDHIKNYLNQSIDHKQLNLFFLEDKSINKVSFGNVENEWSKEIDISTKGVEAILEIKESSKDINIPKEITVSVLTTYTNAFPLSTLIIIEPRYMLINKLPFNVIYSHCKNDDDKLPKKELININENKIINFLSNEKQILQFSIHQNTQVIDKTELEVNIPNTWSSFVDVNSLDDKTVKLLLPKDFDLNNYPEIKNVLIHDKENIFVVIKVILYTKDNGLNFIILTIPEYPQIIIENMINYNITFKQVSTDKEYILSQNSTTPYVWEDNMIDEKKLLITIQDKSLTVDLDKIQEKTSIKLSDKKTIYIVQFLHNNNSTKYMRLFDEKEEDINSNLLQQIFIKKKSSKIIVINIKLQGLGISIIDGVPKEVFFISFYKLSIKLINNYIKLEQENHNITHLIVKLKNIQVDYCLEDSFKTIFYPTLQYIPNREYLYKKSNKNNKDYLPFVQIGLIKKKVQNNKINSCDIIYPQVEVIIQECNVKLDQKVLYAFVDILNSIKTELDFSKENNEIEYDYEGEYIKPTTFDKSLSTSCDLNQDLKYLTDESNMILIENLLISNLRINITLRLELSKLDISNVPIILVRILGTVGNTIARITDFPLVFRRIKTSRFFYDINRMINLIRRNYTNQVFFQIYKLIGSSDLLGNPLGLIDKFSTGFTDLVDKPTKELSNGVGGVGLGMAKGFNSLFSNVIGGSFDSIGKISGSLLTATKNLQGENFVHVNEENEPKNIASGIYEGLKGTAGEVLEGISGVVTKPYHGSKNEGVKGFFKGSGEGIVNLALAPISALLKLTNSLSLGMRNTANFLSDKLYTLRFRHPRQFMKGEALIPYNRKYAEVQEIIRILGNNFDRKILFYSDFIIEYETYHSKRSYLIITQTMFYLCYGIENVVLQFELRSLEECRIHMIEKENKIYLLVFQLYNKDMLFAPTKDFFLCNQVFNILRKIIEIHKI